MTVAPVERGLQKTLELLCVCCAAVAIIALIYGDVWNGLFFAVVAVGCWEAAALLDDE